MTTIIKPILFTPDFESLGCPKRRPGQHRYVGRRQDCVFVKYAQKKLQRWLWYLIPLEELELAFEQDFSRASQNNSIFGTDQWPCNTCLQTAAACPAATTLSKDGGASGAPGSAPRHPSAVRPDMGSPSPRSPRPSPVYSSW